MIVIVKIITGGQQWWTPILILKAILNVKELKTLQYAS